MINTLDLAVVLAEVCGGASFVGVIETVTRAVLWDKVFVCFFLAEPLNQEPHPSVCILRKYRVSEG